MTGEGRKSEVELLKRLSPLLDQALDKSPQALRRWLDGLDASHADILPTLRQILFPSSEAEESNLLERLPEMTGLDLARDASVREHEQGALIGPYRLMRLLGQGGMGDVWLAERADGLLKRLVAIKLPVLSLRRNVLVQRFDRERDILATLNHPHIARLYDAGFAEDGQPYLALEYVQGIPITEYAQVHALDVSSRVALIQQVMEAVQFAHANLVIHRDLKPGNILVTDQGQAQLLDFGIAKLLQAESQHADETELTRMGGRALTLHYAAPEQWMGLPISIAADIWSLGVLLYELTTNNRPFEATTSQGVDHMVIHHDPMRPSLVKGGVLASIGRHTAVDLDTIV
jgi:serine/threonine-protein kinase